jgi:DNA-binding NarL/FixJ family response regulator
VTISVLVVDDHELIRAGIVMLLTAQPDIEVVAQAGTADAAIKAARQHSPDVVLMDIQLPGADGIEATRVLTADPPDGRDHLTRVLILTTFADDESLYPALRAGAHGYLLKHAAPHDLATAIRRVAGGDSWLDPAVAGRVIDRINLDGGGARGPKAETIRSVLTPRELEVFQLMAKGWSNQQITEELVVSEATVKTHVARVLMKTGSRDRAQAVALAYQSGLVSGGR